MGCVNSAAGKAILLGDGPPVDLLNLIAIRATHTGATALKGLLLLKKLRQAPFTALRLASASQLRYWISDSLSCDVLLRTAMASFVFLYCRA